MEMLSLLKPDMGSPGYPRTYNYSAYTNGVYDSFPRFLRGLFDSCGVGSKTDPPTKDVFTKLPAATDHSFTNYAVARANLERGLQELIEADKNVVELARASADRAQLAQEKLNAAIVALNNMASTPAPYGISQDDHMLSYLTQVTERAEEGMKEAHNELARLATEAPDPGKKDPGEDKTPELGDLKPPGEGGDPPPPPDWSSLLGSGGNLNAVPGNGPGVSDRIDDLARRYNPSSPPTQLGAGTGLGAGLGGMDMMSSLMPQLLAQQAMRDMADRSRGDMREAPDLERRERRTDPPPIAAAVPAATPWSAPPAPPAPPAQHASAPSGASSPAQPGPQQPARPREADGSVLYTFPDGRNQKVSAVVAQALDAAFANTTGTDAKAAYADTTAKWSGGKDKAEDPGQRVDPYELMTGDVASWDSGRTAIVITWGSETDGTLEVVVDGAQRMFEGEMHGGDGDFGDFAGFFHPPGIELPAGAASAPPSDVAAADQAGAAPSVAVPAPA